MSDAGLDFLVRALADPSDGRSSTASSSPFVVGTIISIDPVVLRLAADASGASDIVNPQINRGYVPVAGDQVLCAQLQNSLVVLVPVGRAADYLQAFVTFYGASGGIAYVGDDVPPYDAPVEAAWLDLSGDLGPKVRLPGEPTEYDQAQPYRRMVAHDDVAGNATSPSIYWGGTTPPQTESVGSLWADTGDATGVPYPPTQGYWVCVGQGGETWYGAEQPPDDRPRGAFWLDFGDQIT